MVLTCVVEANRQGQLIKKALIGLQVFEETISGRNVVVSVRAETAPEVERVEDAFKNAGVKEISEFSEAA